VNAVDASQAQIYLILPTYQHVLQTLVGPCRRQTISALSCKL
jgi:hypothetical protein